MANTFIKISTLTAGVGGSASFEFTSIPQTYTDLKILLCHRSSIAAAYTDNYIQFNGDTTAGNYAARWLYGDTLAAGSLSRATFNFGQTTASSATASVFSNTEIYIPNYTSTNRKSLSFDGADENNSTTYSLIISAGLWTGTAAITSIKILPPSGTYVQYSTATLYGIKSS